MELESNPITVMGNELMIKARTCEHSVPMISSTVFEKPASELTPFPDLPSSLDERVISQSCAMSSIVRLIRLRSLLFPL